MKGHLSVKRGMLNPVRWGTLGHIGKQDNEDMIINGQQHNTYIQHIIAYNQYIEVETSRSRL